MAPVEQDETPPTKEVWILWQTGMEGNHTRPMLCADSEAEAHAYAYKRGDFKTNMPVGLYLAFKIASDWFFTVNAGWSFRHPMIFRLPPLVQLDEEDMLRFQAFKKLTPEELKAVKG